MLIREAQISDAKQIAKIKIDTWRTTYIGIMSDDYLDNLSYARMEDWVQSRLTDNDSFMYVAEIIPGQIVGYAYAGPEREGSEIYPAELYALYVLKDYQGAGIGRQLVKAVALRFATLGIHSMLIWALADNPYRSFYERLGGHELNSKIINIGGYDLKEIAYTWNDIKILTL